MPLSVHPSRRIRELNAVFHSRLLAQPGIRDEFRAHIQRDSAAGSILAAWALGANDAVATIAASLRSSWDSNVLWRQGSPDDELMDIQDHLEEIVSSVIQAVAEPVQLYQQFSPLAQPPRNDSDTSDAVNFGEHFQDLVARIRTSGLGALAWMLGM